MMAFIHEIINVQEVEKEKRKAIRSHKRASYEQHEYRKQKKASCTTYCGRREMTRDDSCIL